MVCRWINYKLSVLCSNSPHLYQHEWGAAPQHEPFSLVEGDPFLVCTLSDASPQTPELQTPSSNETWSSASGSSYFFSKRWRQKSTAVLVLFPSLATMTCQKDIYYTQNNTKTISLHAVIIHTIIFNSSLVLCIYYKY